jgi:hypothetical protein
MLLECGGILGGDGELVEDLGGDEVFEKSWEYYGVAGVY